MEPNVGTTTRGESASLRSRVNQPLVRRYFREYKSLFQELMGDEFTSAEIEKMAMDEALKRSSAPPTHLVRSAKMAIEWALKSVEG
jgi:AcrR family transcriptional regulator